MAPVQYEKVTPTIHEMMAPPRQPMTAVLGPLADMTRAWKSSAARLLKPRTKMVIQLNWMAFGIESSAPSSVICSPRAPTSPYGYAGTAGRRRHVVEHVGGADDEAEPADDGLDAVGVRDGEEAAGNRVEPDGEAHEPHARPLVLEAEEVGDNLAGADEVAAEEAAERDDREDGEERLGGGAELAREEVGEREQPHLVQRLGEEDAVEDEREAEAEREARAVPPVVLVPEVDVAERGVRVERLRRERRRHDEDVERAACGGRGGTG